MANAPAVCMLRNLTWARVTSLQEGNIRNMASRDRYSSSGYEVNLLNENEADDHFEDDPCLDEEEEIELSLIAPSDDQ